MEKFHLVIYVPAYNVEKPLPELLKRLDKVVKGFSDVNLETFIIVNDGSTDKTQQILQDFKKTTPYIRALNRQKNKGPVRAIFEGMEAAQEFLKKRNFPSDKTIFVRMDADLEHQPEDIPGLISPIIAEKTKISVGFIPFDTRSGFICKMFNTSVGTKESKEFLQKAIPQFCPGFNAIRADLFVKIYPLLKEHAQTFEKRYGCDMVSIDFVILVLAGRLDETIHIVGLSPIEDRWIKKSSIEKFLNYYDLHKKTVEFLRLKLV